MWTFFLQLNWPLGVAAVWEHRSSGEKIEGNGDRVLEEQGWGGRNLRRSAVLPRSQRLDDRDLQLRQLTRRPTVRRHRPIMLSQVCRRWRNKFVSLTNGVGEWSMTCPPFIDMIEGGILSCWWWCRWTVKIKCVDWFVYLINLYVLAG